MNSHPKTSELLTYINAEVTPSQKRLIQIHLANCPQCQESVNRLSIADQQLHSLIKTQADSAEPGEDAWDRLAEKLPGSQKSKFLSSRGMNMKKLTPAYVLVSVLLVLGTLLAIPSVRAQITELITQWVSADLPNDSGSIALGGEDWPFTPNIVTYFPEHLQSRGVSSGIIESPENFSVSFMFELGKDHFIKVVNNRGAAYTFLPKGEDITINGQPAILIREPDLGKALFGEVDDIGKFATHQSFQIIWFINDIQIEVFANFPLEEMVKIAESVEPMQTDTQGDAP